MINWTQREEVFVSPTPARLAMGIARTRDFIRTQGKGTLPRRVHAALHPHWVLDQPCTGLGIPAHDAARLRDLGFRPIAQVRIASPFFGFITTERWIGPDGAILMESSNQGKQFLHLLFENGRKVAVHHSDRTGKRMKSVQGEHRYIASTGDIVQDYRNLVAEALRYQDEHQTRPLFRGADSVGDQAVWRYYDGHVVSNRFLAFVWGRVFLMAAFLICALAL